MRFKKLQNLADAIEGYSVELISNIDMTKVLAALSQNRGS
jgi:hypothetical protein